MSKDELMALADDLRACVADLQEEAGVRDHDERCTSAARTPDAQAVLDLKAENRQLRADLEAEASGNASLRERFGALDHESFPAFVERLAGLNKSAPTVRVWDMSDEGTGPWRLMVNGVGCADWPWDGTEHDAQKYAETVAYCVARGLERAAPCAGSTEPRSATVKEVAGSTPAVVSTVAGSQMPEGERGVDPADKRATAEDSRKSDHYPSTLGLTGHWSASPKASVEHTCLKGGGSTTALQCRACWPPPEVTPEELAALRLVAQEASLVHVAFPLYTWISPAQRAAFESMFAALAAWRATLSVSAAKEEKTK
jgi:hypothetical protein